MTRPPRRGVSLPATVVWPITIARAFMRSRMTSSVGASDASGSPARPRYHNRPGSLAREEWGALLEWPRHREQILPHRGVDPLAAHHRHRLADTAVHEQDPVDARD